VHLKTSPVSTRRCPTCGSGSKRKSLTTHRKFSVILAIKSILISENLFELLMSCKSYRHIPRSLL
jgi:hypothetical protein